MFDNNGNFVVNIHPFAEWMNHIAFVYTCMVLAYVGFVVTLSMFSINLAPLRVAEDVWLLGLVAFACYTVVLDHAFYKEGQYLLVTPSSLTTVPWITLLVGDVSAAKSCKSRFLDYHPLDDLCRTVVASCSEHAPDTFSYGEQPTHLLGRLLTFSVILVFKAVASWYEHRMWIV